MHRAGADLKPMACVLGTPPQPHGGGQHCGGEASSVPPPRVGKTPPLHHPDSSQHSPTTTGGRGRPSRSSAGDRLRCPHPCPPAGSACKGCLGLCRAFHCCDFIFFFTKSHPSGPPYKRDVHKPVLENNNKKKVSQKKWEITVYKYLFEFLKLQFPVCLLGASFSPGFPRVPAPRPGLIAHISFQGVERHGPRSAKGPLLPARGCPLAESLAVFFLAVAKKSPSKPHIKNPTPSWSLPTFYRVTETKALSGKIVSSRSVAASWKLHVTGLGFCCLNSVHSSPFLAPGGTLLGATTRAQPLSVRLALAPQPSPAWLRSRRV